LGSVYKPNHPLMEGVNSISAECPKRYFNPSLMSGSSRIADWTDGSPLIAERKINGVNRVDLNLYPPSSAVDHCYWNLKTDGAKIIANALSIVGRKIVIPSPSYGILSAGSSVSIVLTVDARDLTAGQYNHRFVIESNDPLNKEKYFRVGISVSGNPEIHIDPTSFVFSLNAGDIAERTMKIRNPGTSNLEWCVEGQVDDTIRNKIKRVAEEMRRAAEEKMASGEMPKGDYNTLLSFTPETAVTVAFSENHEPGNLNVLLIYYDGAGYMRDVRDKLLNTGFFNSITSLMEYYGTPTFGQLRSYDAVLVWSGGAYFRYPVQLGNNLADYVDSGGGVVMACLTALPAQYGEGVQGRFNDENYWVIAPSINTAIPASLGKVYQPDNPVMRGVHSFYGGSSSLRYSGGIVDGAARIADWSDGTPLIAEKTMNGISRIDLGFYPPSSVVDQYSWSDTTDGTLIIANTLKYVAKKYVSLVPPSGMIIPGDSQTVSVKIRTDDLIGRVYNSAVSIASNDTINPSVAIPVQLTVTGFPAIGADSNAMNFGVVYEGSSDTLSMNIMNTGTGALSISSITSASSRYSVLGPTSFTIAARSGHIIRVVFTPSGAGVQSSTLTIVSDAVNNPNMTMTLIGNGILPPEQASPLDKSTNIPRLEILRWHPAFFAAEYHLQVAKDSFFTLMIINDSTLTDTTNKTYGWDVGTLYYWRVKAKSPLAVSEWSPTWQFTTRFQPNVYVSRVDGPPTAYSGQDVELRWIVGNMGAVGTNVPSWMDRVYLFPDTAFVPQLAIQVGDFQNVSYLSAGESYANKTTFRLPIGITGNYYVFVRTDFGNQLTEFDETNNLTRSETPIFVNLTPPPDLRVLSIIAPANGFSGEEIEVSWSVKNLGTGSTVTEVWWDGIYVSPDSIFRDSSARAIGAFEHTGALLADSGYSLTKTVKLPNATYGKYYLFVKTDCYNNVYENVWESNNKTRTDSIWIALTPPPDIVVTSIQVPLTGNSGQPLSIRWTVQNQGPGSPFEKGWSDRVYLSRLSSFNPDSVIPIGGYEKTGGLPPDSSYTILSTPTIPNGLSGTYYLYVKTDWDNQVFEYIYEGNNVCRSDAGILVNLSPWPDLQISSIRLPVELTAGEKLTIKWDILNAGLGSTASSKWVDNIYLSDTSAWLPNRTNYIGGVSHTAPLAISQSVTESLVVTLHPSIKGTYYVYVSADAQNSVYEHIDENNNVKLSDSIRILPYPPVDLAVTDISNDTLGFSGKPIKIHAHVENAGRAKTLVSDWWDAVYLSLDTVFNASEDILVTSMIHRGQLLPNGRYSREEYVNLPDGISGTYYLCYRADTMNQVGDDDLNNNVTFSSRTLSISLTPSPDFTITLLSAPDEVFAGQPMTIRWIVQNQGSGANEIPNWSDGIYLSEDTTLGQGDYLLGTQKHSDVLSPGASSAESLTVDIPVYLSGDYYLLFFTDNGRNIYEHMAEVNNIRMNPLTITIPPPSDLIVSAIDLPDSAECGREITISWTIHNQGIYSATGWLNDAIYISGDTIWQDDDPLFGMNYHYIDLPPGGSMKVSVMADLDRVLRADPLGTIVGDMPGVALGEYHAIVRTDIRNNIRESNELNNSMASDKIMNVDMPLIEVGVPTSAKLIKNQYRYYRVRVAADLDLNVTLTSNFREISNEVYVAYDRAPTLNDFDYSAALPFTANQELIVPTTKAGTYYILILGRGFPADVDTENISILATALPLSVVKISPSAGGSGGLVSCRLEGAGFREGMMVYLRNAKDSTYEGTILKFINSTQCDIRWNLENVPLGMYDVVVKNPDSSSAYASGGFAVEALRHEGIFAEHNVPEILPGRLSRMHTLHLAHTWNIDLPYLVVQIAIPNPQPIEVYSDRLKGFRSIVPDSLKHLTKNYYTSGDWRFVPLIARDVRVGEIVQLNIALQGIQYEHYYLPMRILVHAIDKSVFTDAIESQIDLARQLVLQDPSKWDSVTVALAHDSYLFRNNMIQFYVSSGIFDKDQLGNQNFKSMAKENTVTSMPGKPPGGGFGKVTCEILCGEVVACAVSIVDCGVDLGLGPFGGIIELPMCAYGVAASCVLPAFGISTGAAGCVGLVSGSYCTLCATACPYVLQVCDPNDITGPLGYGDEKWITQSLTLPYTIRYENDPAKATAPVKTVIVTLPLDSTLDARTFRLGNFGFGSFVFPVPENRAFYAKRLDVRDSLGVFVDINAGIDLVKNEAFWILKSIDPVTGQGPLDPLTGFLPVDDSMMHGQGFFNYTVKSKATSRTLEKIDAVASIVFDLNEPLNTPKIFNTIDADKPTSQVHALVPNMGSEMFNVSWSGGDSTGSGIRNYTIYFSVNDDPYTVWLKEVIDTSSQFIGVKNNRYSFYSIACDNAGNYEKPKSQPDTYTLITGVEGTAHPLPQIYALDQNFPNPFNPATTIKYELPTDSKVSLKVYNVLGQVVAVLVDEVQAANYKSVEWNTSAVSSSVYFYKLEATSVANPSKSFTQVKKMILLK
jgi:hypothetical protein